MQEVNSVQVMLNLRCQWDNQVRMHIWELGIGLTQKYGLRRLEVASPETIGEDLIAQREKRAGRENRGAFCMTQLGMNSQSPVRLSRNNQRGRREEKKKKNSEHLHLKDKKSILRREYFISVKTK